MKVNEEIMVSVYVPTYNHEKFIIQALDSILMQKCSFPIEILVGEDKSTDKTREILKEYQKKHFNEIQFFFREENMSNLMIHNSPDLRSRCRGKYIIGLEGDDFWIDENKLEKQVCFLENNQDYIAVAHKTKVVDENNIEKRETYPECLDKEYTFFHYLVDIMPGQLTTVMMRNFYKNGNIDTSYIDKGLLPGDRRMFFFLLCYGKIACLSDVMSCYRHVTSSGSSYSANYYYDFKRKLQWQINQLNFAKSINKKDPIEVAKTQYFFTLMAGLKRKDISLEFVVNEIRKLKLSIGTIKKIIFRGLKIKKNK